MVHDIEEGIRAVLDEQDTKQSLSIAYGGIRHGLHIIEPIEHLLTLWRLGAIQWGGHFIHFLNIISQNLISKL